MKPRVNRVEILSTTSLLDRADTNYLGKSSDYWEGYSYGMTDALKVLELLEHDNYAYSMNNPVKSN